MMRRRTDLDCAGSGRDPGRRNQPLPRRHLFGSSSNANLASFYGQHEQEEESCSVDRAWHPGEYLPSTTASNKDIPAMLTDMQKQILAKMDDIEMSLSALSNRVEVLEESVEANTEKIRDIDVAASSFSTPPSSDKKRARHTPTSLSNLVHTIHNKLPQEKKLKALEPISSDHNSAVVSAICREISPADYSRSEVKKALQTYRRTLARKSVAGEDERKLKRTRQQRKYERRGRHIVDEEQDKWKDVLPTMMSDEEEASDGGFTVHRQQWRSEELCKLLEELDGRALAANVKRPRYERTIGSPRNDDPPIEAKSWMVAKTNSPPNSPELI